MEIIEPIRVLITGVAGGSIGEQVYKALRRGRHRYHITAANTDARITSVVDADKSAALPPANAPDYIESLLRLVSECDIQFVVPGSEPELIQISRNRERFSQSHAHLMINSDEVIQTCLNKVSINRLLKEKGFPVPSTFAVQSISDLDQVPAKFPYVVKPTGGSGSASAFIAQTLEELRFFARYLLDDGLHPVVQEYIGTVDQEYTVGVLHLSDGTLFGSIALRRQILSGFSNRLKVLNRCSNKELGNMLALSSGISQGTIVPFPELCRQAEAIATSLKSVGPLNIQGRWDGHHFLPFEINPRFSGTTPIRAMAGFNEPEILIDSYLGLAFTAQPPQKEIEFVRGLVEYEIEKQKNR